jgi:hypothetical protein
MDMFKFQHQMITYYFVKYVLPNFRERVSQFHVMKLLHQTVAAASIPSASY